MAKEGLDGPDVVVGLQKMSGKGVAQSVSGHALGELRFFYRLVQRLLETRVVHMIPPPFFSGCDNC